VKGQIELVLRWACPCENNEELQVVSRLPAWANYAMGEATFREAWAQFAGEIKAHSLAAPSVEQDERGAVIATVRTDPPITGVTTGPWTRLFVADVEIDRSGDPTELVKKAEQINHSYAHQSRAASTSANVAQGAELVHLDDWWVDLFAKEMKAKLENARAKGRGGWQDCDPADLSRMLGEHVEKGDPRDVANFCMFLWALRSPICADPPAQTALADAQKWEIAERVHAQCERLKPHATFRSAASQAINDTLDALTAAQSASGDK
jgi:hypothetical protein